MPTEIVCLKHFAPSGSCILCLQEAVGALRTANDDLHDTIGRMLKIQSQLQIENAKLRTDCAVSLIETATKDALRYRWLRACNVRYQYPGKYDTEYCDAVSGNTLDAAVDGGLMKSVK